MRTDMFKVIVERPRWGRGSTGGGSDYPRGSLKNQWAPDLEAAPRMESMGGRYAQKELNENLQPLLRLLRTNVGRAWDEVHSEIAAHLSCRSAVQKRVLDHLRDFVAEEVRLEEATVLVKGWRGFEPLVSSGARIRFYVCPRTRMLRLAPPVARKRGHSTPPADRRVLSEEHELRCVSGIWYEVTVAPIPAGNGIIYDILERAVVGSSEPRAAASGSILWRTGRYAVRKRQLNGREIAQLGLRSPRSRG